MHRQIRLLASGLAMVAGWHAASAQGEPCYFRSGFEPGTTLHQYELNGQPHPKYADLYGTDASTGYDWVVDLDEDPCMGNFRIYYQVGDTLRAKASLAPDPDDAANTVLRFQLFDANVLDTPHPRGRIQAAIRPNEPLHAFGFRVRMWLHPDLSVLSAYEGTFGWFTLMEFWNDLPTQAWPFRITLNLVKPQAAPGSALRLGVHGQVQDEGSWQDVWSAIDTSFTLPFGQWLHLYVSFVEGDSTHGRFQLALLDSAGVARPLFDLTHFTHHPDDPAPDGIQTFNPMKLYTSATLIDALNSQGAQIVVLWDDFEFWPEQTVSAVPAAPAQTELPVCFPNPCTHILYLSEPHGVLRALVCDLKGRPLLQQLGPLGEWEVSHLPKGVYMLRLWHADGKQTATMFVKQ